MKKMIQKNKNFPEDPNDFLEFIYSCKGNILVKFFAHWCLPCKVLSEKLESLDNYKKFFLVEIDIDKFAKFRSNDFFSVKTVPKVFFFRDGKLINKIDNSLISIEELEKILSS